MNKSFVISALCLVLALCLMLWGFREPEVSEKKAPRYFALMTEDIGTDVLQFKQGAQAAAKEIGANVTFLTCAQSSPAEAELRSLLNSLEPLSADGIVIPRGGEGLVSEAMLMNIPVVCLFPTTVPKAISVTTDFYALGAELGTRAAEERGHSGFWVFHSGTEEEMKMLDGLKSQISAPVEVITAMPEEIEPAAASLPVGAVAFALSGGLTLSLSGDSRIRLWGMDPGASRVALLKSGAVHGLAMEMPYAMGYLAIMAVATPPTKGVRSPARVITPDQIYLPENVKLMFPLLQ